MTLKPCRLSPLLFLVGFVLPDRAVADLVTDANTTLMESIREFSTGATPASREFAILQTAIFDAVNGVERTYQSYRVAPAAPAGTSAEAAAAAAAHTVLTALYPAKAASFNAILTAQLGALPFGTSQTARNDGLNWGHLVATNILNWRAGDNADALVNYVSGSQPGNWRPTAPNFGAPDNPQWPNVTPWTLTGGSQFRPAAGPPALNSQEYTAYYTQVFELGAASGSARTPAQTDTALFWSYNTGSQTAVGHWNSIAQVLAAGKNNSLVENARLFAALNTSLADAAIVASDAAYTYDFWRPISAIREAATDGNINTTPLVNWDPLVPTPSSPEYIASNAVFAGAASTVLNSIIGTDVPFSIGSDRIPTLTLSYASVDFAAADATVAGIYGGIQFRNSGDAGLAAGQLVATQTVTNFFNLSKIPEPSGSALLLLAALGAQQRRRRN